MRSKKQNILAILAGELLFVFFILGQNANLFKSIFYLNLVGVILGVLLLYTVVITLVSSNSINYALVSKGYARAYIIFITTFFISIIIKQFVFKTEKIIHPKSIIEKEKLEFTSNFKACNTLKYGTFLVDDRDTIIRYTEDNKELETLITNGKSTLYTIKWIDSCTYIRIDRKSRVATLKVKLGNINEIFHNLYISPVNLHKLDDEQVLNCIKIK